jgi:hypothetical protein
LKTEGTEPDRGRRVRIRNRVPSGLFVLRILAEYARRQPETTPLYRTLQAHWLEFLAEVEADGWRCTSSKFGEMG